MKLWNRLKQLLSPKREQPLYMQCSVVCAANAMKAAEESIEQKRKGGSPHEA